MVVAFEKMAKAEEANLFVTINHEQKSVPKNLLDRLEGELKWGSTRQVREWAAITARLINLLNADFVKPVREGDATGHLANGEDLSDSAGAEEWLRRSGLVGKTILGGERVFPGPLTDLTDALTLERARDVLNAYFGQLSAANVGFGSWAGRALCARTLRCRPTSSAQFSHCLHGGPEIHDCSRTGASRLMAEIGEYLVPILTWTAAMSPELMAQQFKGQYGSEANSVLLPSVRTCAPGLSRFQPGRAGKVDRGAVPGADHRG